MGKKQGNTVETVRQLVAPVVEEMNLSLWDITFDKEGADWFLKVLVEKNDGDIDILTCEALSRKIDPMLDEEDPIEQSYFLEVGSPGLGRRLRTAEHFERYLGQEVYVRLIRPDSEGRREIQGDLISFDGGEICIKAESEINIKLSDSAFVKLCDDNF